jgi:hypothetical protein
MSKIARRPLRRKSMYCKSTLIVSNGLTNLPSEPSRRVSTDLNLMCFAYFTMSRRRSSTWPNTSLLNGKGNLCAWFRGLKATSTWELTSASWRSCLNSSEISITPRTSCLAQFFASTIILCGCANELPSKNWGATLQTAFTETSVVLNSKTENSCLIYKNNYLQATSPWV